MKILYKDIGETPLELIQRKNLDGSAYAGRLDPMAEGLMIVLDKVEEKKNRKKFENLRKTYEFDVLLGIQTDTYDILGLPKLLGETTDIKPIKIGEFVQKYPPYSYFRVKGKPLFWWARNNKLTEIQIPKKKITIFKFVELENYKITNSEFLNYIQNRIEKVKGDFRQKKILQSWQTLLEKDQEFICKKFKVECSSGTYVRSLANDINGTAINIKRIQVGDFSLADVLD